MHIYKEECRHAPEIGICTGALATPGAGWRGRVRETQAIELFLDIFNITNRVNFDNPITANSDRRLPSTFLVLTNLAGGGGFPRQAQIGFRYTF